MKKGNILRKNNYEGKQEKFRTTNNVPVSKYILSESNKILKNIKFEDIYNYPNHDIDIPFIKNELYIHYGVDGIIKDLLYVFRNKSIYFEKQNYRMVEYYADCYGLTYTPFENADVVYISNPNGVLLKKLNNNEIKEMIKDKSKIFILDLSYDIYTYENTLDFFSFIEEITCENVFILFGLSKMLGLPALRVGFCIGKDVFSEFHQPWQITQISKIFVQKLFNIETISKHVKIIQESKKYFEKKFKDQIIFETDGPFLALSFEGREQNTSFKRFSIIDKKLYKK